MNQFGLGWQIMGWDNKQIKEWINEGVNEWMDKWMYMKSKQMNKLSDSIN